MALTREDIDRILEIGLRLSAERDFGKLWEYILDTVMEITECDAATFYLLENNALYFRIMRNKTLKTYSGQNGQIPKLPPVPMTRESVCALAAIEKKTILADDVRNSTEYDFTGPIKYDAMTGYYTKSMLVVPMMNRSGQVIGVMQLINAMNEDGEIVGFSKDEVKSVESIASQAAVTIENMRYIEEVRELFDSVVMLLSAAVDERTSYNGSHTRHMVENAERWIEWMNQRCMERGEEPKFSNAAKRELVTSVWFHDLGKLVTPLEVMNKEARLLPEQKIEIEHRMERIHLLSRIDALEGKISKEAYEKICAEIEAARETIHKANTCGFLQDALMAEVQALAEKTYTDEQGEIHPWLEDAELKLLMIRKGTLSAEEREIMEQHVVLTDKFLSNLHFTDDLQHVRAWAASHHELLNGSGYPQKLQGEDICQEVRMITILDIFDALVADDRPYKPGMPIEKALNILTEMAEKEGKLDPELLALFKESRCWEKREA